jgi:hypothetical protein
MAFRMLYICVLKSFMWAIIGLVNGHNVVKVKEARAAWGNPGCVRLKSGSDEWSEAVRE